jgi:hypothetical protein
MKKILYTLNVPTEEGKQYEPEIVAMTLPLMKNYAKKIGAEFVEIKDRKFPDYPIPYEKFQIYDLAKKSGADWNIFADCDALCHKDYWDPTVLLPMDTTASYGTDFTPMRFKPDAYFLRDGRYIGKGNWLGIFSKNCLDYYHPLDDITKEEAVANITPTAQEQANGCTATHLLDDYTVSRNISRYGLKHVLLPELEAARKAGAGYLYHMYAMTSAKKLLLLRKTLLSWILFAVYGPIYTEEINRVNATVNTWDGTISLKDFVSTLPQSEKIFRTFESWGVPL